MPDTERYWDPNVHRYEQRETKSETDVAKGSIKAGAEGLKPKATGRGMLPGESVTDWKARLRKMDEEKDNAVQVKALTK